VGEGRGLEAARKLAAFVHSHMKYELGVSYQRADEILKEGRGDCLEYSTLLVALCRGLGIPARVVSGLAYAGTETPGFAYHAWAEIQHEGRWVPLDPTWNAPVDAAHIKLDKEGGYAALSLLGSLKVKLLEADYSGSH
jgi:transglutaminase-like putative cysteine protease